LSSTRSRMTPVVVARRWVSNAGYCLPAPGISDKPKQRCDESLKN
jgi:hypothetical protein